MKFSLLPKHSFRKLTRKSKKQMKTNVLNKMNEWTLTITQNEKGNVSELWKLSSGPVTHTLKKHLLVKLRKNSNFPNIWQKSCWILNRQIRKWWVQTFGDKEQTEKLDVDRQDVSSTRTFFFYTTCTVWLKVENNKGSRVLCKRTYFVYANSTCWLLCFYTLWRATHPHVYEVQHKPMF